MFEQLQDQWQQLARRERFLVSTVTTLVVVFIVYFWCWKPLSNAVDVQAAQAQQEMQDLAWFRHATAKLQAYQRDGLNIKKLIASSKKKVDQKNVLAVAKSSLKKSGLSRYMSGSKPIPQGESNKGSKSPKNISYIELKFSAAPFITLTKWLQQIWREDHIALTSIKIKKSTGVGVVDVDLQLGY